MTRHHTRLGLLTLGRYTPDELKDLVQLCEHTGYETLWFADERFFRDPWASLAYAATCSSTLKFGVCVTDPFVRHPALTATALATVDEISGGRMTLGLGAGVSGFKEMGIERRKPVTALREAVELIRRLLAGERVSMLGEVVHFHDGAINFPGRADIEFLIAANGPLTLRLAGEVADGVIVQGMASELMVHNVRALLAEGAARSGREVEKLRLVARLDLCIAEDGTAARDAMRPGVVRHLKTHHPRFNSQRLAGLDVPLQLAEAVAGINYGHSTTEGHEIEQMIPIEFIERFCLAGTVEETAAQTARLLRAGVDDIVVFPVTLPGQEPHQILEQFATQVMPRAQAMTMASDKK
jgi:5,10-methylenetetrahydromethanopterin reductase